MPSDDPLRIPRTESVVAQAARVAEPRASSSRPGRRHGGPRSASLLLLLGPWLLSSCTTFCAGERLLDEARQGDPRAVHEAGEFGDPLVPVCKGTVPVLAKAYEALRPNLAAHDANLRLIAVEALRRLSARSRSLYRDRFAGLLDPLLFDPEPEVRWRAAWALGRLRLSCEALRKAALDPVDRVAERAVWALGEARDERAAPYLLRAIERPSLLAVGARSLRRITGLEIGADLEAWQRAAAAGGVEAAPLPAERPH